VFVVILLAPTVVYLIQRRRLFQALVPHLVGCDGDTHEFVTDDASLIHQRRMRLAHARENLRRNFALVIVVGVHCHCHGPNQCLWMLDCQACQQLLEETRYATGMYMYAGDELRHDLQPIHRRNGVQLRLEHLCMSVVVVVVVVVVCVYV
jgi:hypothetical protein